MTASGDLEEIKVNEIKRQLAQFVADGRVDEGVLSLVMRGKSCIPLECELLDYKQLLQDDKLSYAKAMIRILSLYNTYGGYLLFGVEERQSEVEFWAVGMPRNSIDLERIKAMLKEYTGERISLTMSYFPLPPDQSQTPSDLVLALLYVPKRTHAEPLCFGKTGPEDNKRPIFTKDDSFYRKGDECLLVKGKSILFLAGPRDCPYGCLEGHFDTFVGKRVKLVHNLPDRNFICPRFVGRRGIIEQLWDWFADEFSHVRVLAGEGGLGKTSIAYQFAEEICAEADSGLERVLWLTAKKLQFSGIQNQLVEVPETHFSSYDELLRLLAAELGFMESEIEGASEKLLKRYIQEGARLTPSLIIVDDVDSLDPEQQKKVLEIGFLFGGTESRLLLTTRVNQSYSTDIAIQIKGFGFDDYIPYVESLQARYPYVCLSESQVRVMHDATNGSPMFTESLYRIMRWLNPGNAIQEWRGKLGEEARAAAICREVDQLSPEAKRILLTAAFFRECSFSEISDVTGYPDQVLGDRINELRSLYLLSAPQVTSEARFKINSNTQQYALRNRNCLAIDYQKIEHRVKELRSQTKAIRVTATGNHVVGAAIGQALAQLKRGLTTDAIETIVAAEKRCKGHPDLLTMHARCLLKSGKADDARRVARKAYEASARKEILFDVWYEAEWDSKHYTGALEAAECWTKYEDNPAAYWWLRKALALWHIATELGRGSHIDRAISEYWSCDEQLEKYQSLISSEERREVRKRRFEVHDAVWNLLQKRESRAVDTAVQAIDSIRRMIKTGDYRVTNYLHLVDALEWLNAELERNSRKKATTKAFVNLIEQRYREVLLEINLYSKNNPDDSRFDHVRRKYEIVNRTFSSCLE
jgi:hypothetical protein